MRRRGSMLVVVMMITLVLLMLVMVVGSNTIENMRATSAVTDKREARYAAYAGMQRALVELQKNPDWSDGFADEPMPGKPSLCYTVEVRNNMSGSLDQKGVPVDQQVPPKSVMLDAKAGDRYDPTKPIRAITGLSGLAVPKNAVFQQAAFTDSTISMKNGAVTEAFDFGAWAGKERADDIHDTLKGWIHGTSMSACPEGGKVLANRRMGVEGAKVDGDVTLPKQNKKGTGLKSGTDYTGTETILKQMQPMPVFRAPYDPDMAKDSLSDFPDNTWTDSYGQPQAAAKTLAPGAYKDVTVKGGQRVKLTSGTYYFKDAFTVRGDVEIDASGGPVMVYVGSDMLVEGKLNDGGAPRDLQVYFCDEKENKDYKGPVKPTPTPLPDASPSDDIDMDVEDKRTVSDLTMKSGSRATMVTAGKNTRANLEGARLMGAIVVDNLNLDDSKIQYDKDLRSQSFFANCQWALSGVHERALGR